MAFWKNVESEREYQGLSRKELAFRANIAYAGIGLGLERDSMPGADTAVRVAKVLNVSLEYLLGEDATKIRDADAKDEAQRLKDDAALYQANKSVIDALDKIPVSVREPVTDMILRIAKGTGPEAKAP